MSIAFVSSWYHEPYSHKTPKLGGSEYMICNMALEMRKCFKKVFVFNERFASETIDGIKYHSDKKFEEYVKYNKLDVVVVMRDSHFTKMVSNNKLIKKYFMWCQDNACRFGEPELGKNFGGFILLSKAHEEYFRNYYAFNTQLVKIHIVPNFMDYDYIKKFKTPKIAGTFIYTSMFDRGASLLLLKYWTMILKRYPESKLSLCCDIPEEYKNLVNHESIIHTGRIPKQELYRKLWSSEYWIYPSVFPETACIAAMEAQACECICIHNQLGALKETIQSNQIIIDDNDLIEKMENHKNEVDYDYVKSMDRSKVAGRFRDVIK